MSRDIRSELTRERREGPAHWREHSPDPSRDHPLAPGRDLDRDRERVRVTRTWSPSDRLTLPRSRERQTVSLNRETFTLRGSEVELLATVGAFRTIFVRDLEDRKTSTRDEKVLMQKDLYSVREQGLLETHKLVIGKRPDRVAVLTKRGLELLERSRQRREPGDPPEQRFYRGIAAARDLTHDARLYLMFETDREGLEAEGARITRAVLDYELRSDCGACVDRQKRAGVDPASARHTCARYQDLPFADGQVRFPDVRVEYETADGIGGWRDLELATEHYGRSQIGGKQTAGFRVYRAASRRSSDPHHLEWIT
jgi:hypothetical protein